MILRRLLVLVWLGCAGGCTDRTVTERGWALESIDGVMADTTPPAPVSDLLHGGCYNLSVSGGDELARAVQRRVQFPGLVFLSTRPIGFEDYYEVELSFEQPGVYSGRAAAWRQQDGLVLVYYWSPFGVVTYRLIKEDRVLSGTVDVSAPYLDIRGRWPVVARPFVCADEMAADAATARAYLAGPASRRS